MIKVKRRRAFALSIIFLQWLFGPDRKKHDAIAQIPEGEVDDERGRVAMEQLLQSH